MGDEDQNKNKKIPLLSVVTSPDQSKIKLIGNDLRFWQEENRRTFLS